MRKYKEQEEDKWREIQAVLGWNLKMRIGQALDALERGRIVKLNLEMLRES